MLKGKRINIIYSCLGIFVVLIIVLAIAGAMSNEKEKFQDDKQISTEEFEKQLFNEKDSDKEEVTTEDTEEKIEPEKKEEISEEPKSESNSNSTVTNQTQNQQQNNQSQTQSSSQNKQQTNQNNSVQNNTSTQKVTQPWEELGISENDYYNKPMWSFAQVNFKVEDYSNKAATEAACQKESMRFLNEEGKASSCTNVNSYSGRYLGEWLKVE